MISICGLVQPFAKPVIAMRLIFLFLTAVILGGCSIQRSQLAEQAKSDLVGRSKSDILSCMGPPGNTAALEGVEVWQYISGDGTRTSSGAVTVDPSTGLVSTTSSSRGRSCTVNVEFQSDTVKKVTYLGRTGGPLTSGEQCAYAVSECIN
jgi:outer membrane protein assembly factor BamE (lipoprotein component of BamABCDE complex)